MNAKSAVITGSSRGIGEAIAIEFAKAGYDLVINSRDQEELSISKEEIIRAAKSTTKVRNRQMCQVFIKWQGFWRPCCASN